MAVARGCRSASVNCRFRETRAVSGPGSWRRRQGTRGLTTWWISRALGALRITERRGVHTLIYDKQDHGPETGGTHASSLMRPGNERFFCKLLRESFSGDVGARGLKNRVALGQPPG